MIGLVGGDHSSPYGAIQAISEKYKKDFGILHIDAHADLRKAYEGFLWSHASIMYNVMESSFAPKKLVQVGIRDFCEFEYDYSNSRKDIVTFFDLELANQVQSWVSWRALCDQIVSELPQNVYISFDIDGLDPSLCPNTGTPFPGGLSYAQALALLKSLEAQGKRIVGFDLCEVSPGESEMDWDGNVGARILYKLCGWALLTNK